ncbi:MAG: HIT domain-containing protein [Candidatus Pacearchaeota archaeon]
MANEEIPDEQIQSLKESLIEQVNSNSEATQEQKENFKQKIESMNKEEFVEFLKSQGIINESGEVQQGGGQGGSQQQCIFCSIVDGKVDSYVLSDEEKAKAVLDINPISEGHSLVIPKTHSKEAPQEAQELAKKVSEQIKKKLQPKEVKQEEQVVFGHKVVNLIPVYDENTLKNERKQASKEELEKMLETLYLGNSREEEKVQEETESEHEEEPITDQNTILPKRKP